MSRKRWVYREVSPGEVVAIPVGEDWTDAPASTGDLGKFEYDGCKAPDGTDISSKSKLMRYLKENNLALAHEYKGEWEKAAKEREAFRRGEKASNTARREALGRALYAKHKGFR